MTDYLDEIQARANAATDGPWAVYMTMHAEPKVIREGGGYPAGLIAEPSNAPDDYGIANAEFIAHARTDVPRLVAALRAVEALCDRADAAQSPDEDGVAWGYWIDNATIRTAIRDALEAR